MMPITAFFLSWMFQIAPDTSYEPKGNISEMVDDFPKLVALCSESLAENSSRRSLRRLYNRLQGEIVYSESVSHLKAKPFPSVDLLFKDVWSMTALFLIFLPLNYSLIWWVQGWKRAWRLSLVFATIIMTVILGFTFRERQIESRFEEDKIVLKVPTMLKAGDGPLYPDRLPAALPAGHVMRKAHESADWFQVEYAPGEFGWLPKASAIEVVRPTPI